MTALQHRYDFVYMFDVANGNPNGDPDAGNLPRLDPETNQGLVTDVCLKRKIRNFVEMAKGGEPGFDIYVQERAILNRIHEQAYADNAIPPSKKPLKGEAEQTVLGWLCSNYFDIRTFGAVMSTGDHNCGQVRGPVQLAFARSIDPVMPLEISITRMAVASEREAEKQQDNRTMGRKHIVPYGLYRAHGFISAKLAEKTGFSDGDLELLWQALATMFDHDRSAARGEMNARALIAFEHDSALGNAPAHKLFDLVKVKPASDEDAPARSFSDYQNRISVDEQAVPNGVTLKRMI